MAVVTVLLPDAVPGEVVPDSSVLLLRAVLLPSYDDGGTPLAAGELMKGFDVLCFLTRMVTGMLLSYCCCCWEGIVLLFGEREEETVPSCYCCC